MPSKIIEAVQNILEGMNANEAVRGFTRAEKAAVVALYNETRG